MVRIRAAHNLAQLGPVAAPYAEKVAPLLEDTDLRVSTNASKMLIAAGAAAVPFIPNLLQHCSSDVRRRAVCVLLGIGEAAAPAAQFLAPLMQDESVRSVAVAALKGIGAPALQYVAAFASGKSPSTESTRVGAAEILGTGGEAAVLYLPELGAMLRDPNVAVRVAACKALGSVGAPAAPCCGDLAAILGDTEPRARFAAVEALGLVGAPAVPSVARLLKVAEVVIRRGAVEALGNIGAASEPYVMEIEAMREGSLPIELRTTAAKAAEKIARAIDARDSA